MHKTLAIMNPISGNADLAAAKTAVDRYFGAACLIHETREQENLRPIIEKARLQGIERVLAFGGDGTISTVADAVAGSDLPLGVIPVGTANLLARELSIPLDLDAACQLAADQPTVQPIDTMRVGARHYISHISLGIYSQLIEHTSPEIKQQLGRAAYVWAMLKELQEYPTWQFDLMLDGQPHTTEASMIVAANVGAVGIPPLRWGPNISPTNGRFTLCIVHASTASDYFQLIWHTLRGEQAESEQIEYVEVGKTAVITPNDPDVAVRADGEIIGSGSVSIELESATVQIIIPEVES